MEALGRQLQQQTEREGTESAAIVDLRSGARIGDVVGGVSNRVNISGHLGAMQAGHEYVHLHTHPASTSFSDQDGGMLAAHAGLHLLAVIGLDGTWYLLGKRRDTEPAMAGDVLCAFRDEVLLLRPQYRVLVRSNAMTTEQAWRAMIDEVWQRVAAKLGLQYRRVDVSQDATEG